MQSLKLLNYIPHSFPQSSCGTPHDRKGRSSGKNSVRGLIRHCLWRWGERTAGRSVQTLQYWCEWTQPDFGNWLLFAQSSDSAQRHYLVKWGRREGKIESKKRLSKSVKSNFRIESQITPAGSEKYERWFRIAVKWKWKAWIEALNQYLR